jgi:hypothetical protein
MPRLTIRLMIVEDLGYCCPYFFFSHFRRTPLIAARLGVTPRAVRYARADCGTCEGKEGCLRKKITVEGGLRKRPLP